MDKKGKRNLVAGTVVIVIGLLILGYMGFIPGLSDLMGTNIPLDLNIKYTSKDYDSASAKLGVTITTLPPNPPLPASITIKNLKPVTTTLNSAELTAFANELAQRWKDSPLKSIQIRINNDGTLEVDGIILVERYDGFAKAAKIPDSFTNKIKPVLSLIRVDPALYMKCTLAITEGKSSLDISKLKIANIEISAEDISQIETTGTTYLDLISRPSRELIRNLSFKDGIAYIDGNLPNEIDVSAP
jgi:hypothetical protein